MTKNQISATRSFRKIIFLQILLVMIFTVSCNKKKNQNSRQAAWQSEWWYPLIQKHKIDLNQFSYKATFNCINDSNVIVSRWLELGNDNGSDEKYIKLKDALLIVVFDTANIKLVKQNYWILSTRGIFHDPERKIIDYERGKLTWYDINDKDIIPLDTMESYGKIDFNYALKIEPGSFRRITP
jgi:hypothetical protein